MEILFDTNPLEILAIVLFAIGLHFWPRKRFVVYAALSLFTLNIVLTVALYISSIFRLGIHPNRLDITHILTWVASRGGIAAVLVFFVILRHHLQLRSETKGGEDEQRPRKPQAAQIAFFRQNAFVISFVLLILLLVSLKIVVPILRTKTSHKHLKAILEANAAYVVKINEWQEAYSHPEDRDMLSFESLVNQDLVSYPTIHDRTSDDHYLIHHLYPSETTEKGAKLYEEGDYDRISIEFLLYEKHPPVVAVALSKPPFYDCFQSLPKKTVCLATLTISLVPFEGQRPPPQHYEKRPLTEEQCALLWEKGPGVLPEMEEFFWYAIDVYGASRPGSEKANLPWLKRGDYALPEWEKLDPETQEKYRTWLLENRPQDVKLLEAIGKKGYWWQRYAFIPGSPNEP